MATVTESGTPVETVIETVRAWPGVTLGPHPYDGVEFLLGDYEFGHVHRGWECLHINFPRRMRDTLIAAGSVEEHQYFSDSGWTNAPLDDPRTVEHALWLLRLSYLYRAIIRQHTSAGKTALDSFVVRAELDELDLEPDLRVQIESVIDRRR